MDLPEFIRGQVFPIISFCEKVRQWHDGAT